MTSRSKFKRKLVPTTNVGFTEVKRNGTGWESITEFPDSFKELIGDDASIFELKGHTDPLDDFIAIVSTHELQIKVLKS